ncbi:hypothetical protein UFOVP1566_20 [uncultured Caudovirales phage]|jgi:hypothetical protein|uniref:Uncharacterized protein n=1 Tax=uncultured Caudovirales phage TaxID=2100421 RepID=A0A6J7XFS9_9CAUD|nr:hypothetical protein UFOVP1389_38 [uncultured Caudovirales phage]CAB5229785.1 hypothetical protein UFOVP1566_20 [uncultured Caudovirales phage]
MAMTRSSITTVVEIVGGVLVVCGCAMLSISLAFIVAGVGLILLGGLSA